MATSADVMVAIRLTGSIDEAVRCGLISVEEVASWEASEKLRMAASSEEEAAVRAKIAVEHVRCPRCGCSDGRVTVSRGYGRCTVCRPIHVWRASPRPKSLRGWTHRRE